MQGVSLKDSLLYCVDGDPVYFLSDEQVRYLTELFTWMRQDFASDYAYKYHLLRNQLFIGIHEAARLQPASSAYPAVATNAAERVTSLFLTLLKSPSSTTSSY